MSSPAQLAIPAGWIAWAFYWVWSSRGVKPVRRRESRASRAAHVVPLAVATALLAAPLPGWLGERCWPDGDPTLAAAILLVASGLAFSVWARRVLGGNWSATVTLKDGHEIVRSGPYRYVRHPIYTGLIIALAGTAVAVGEWRGLAALALACVALWRKLRMEERWLTEEFGARYADYRRETRALFPFVL